MSTPASRSKNAQAKSSRPKRKQQQKPPQARNVNAPVSVGTVGRIANPRTKTSKDGRIYTATHKELIGSIIGSAGFSVRSYAINPGLQALFTWLSQIAPNYDSYMMLNLRFVYEPACASTQVGQVYITVDFDPSDPAPASEQDIAAYEGTKYGSPWTRHSYECARHNLRKRTSYFVRSAPLAAGQDLGLYDVGNLFVATTDNGGAVPLGRLWVEYTVKFLTPQTISNGVGTSQSGRLNGPDNFATAPTVTGNLPIMAASVAAGILTVTFNRAYQGLMSFYATGTGLTAIANTTSTARRTTINSAGTDLQWQGTFSSTFSGDGFTLQLTATTVTAWVLRIGQYNIAVNA